jgi:hypothetical protein
MLRVSVRGIKFGAQDACFDQSVDGVRSRSSNAHYADIRLQTRQYSLKLGIVCAVPAYLTSFGLMHSILSESSDTGLK